MCRTSTSNSSACAASKSIACQSVACVGNDHRYSSHDKSTRMMERGKQRTGGGRTLQLNANTTVQWLLAVISLLISTSSVDAQQVISVNVSTGLPPNTLLSTFSVPSTYMYGTQFTSATVFAVAQPCFVLSGSQMFATSLTGVNLYSAQCQAALSNTASSTFSLYAIVKSYFSTVRFDVQLTPSCTPKFRNTNLRLIVAQNANVSYSFRAASSCVTNSLSYAIMNDTRFVLSGTSITVQSGAAIGVNASAQLFVSASTASAGYALLSVSIQLVPTIALVAASYQLSTVSNAPVGSVLLTMPAGFTFFLVPDAASAYLDFTMLGNQLTVARPLRCFTAPASRNQFDPLQAGQFGQPILQTSQNASVCYLMLLATTTGRPVAVQASQLLVNVQFANAYTPLIVVTPVTTSSSGTMLVPESAPAALAIAYINVTDADIGLNALVSLAIVPSFVSSLNTLTNTLGSSPTQQSSVNVSLLSLVNLQRVTSSSWILVTSQKAFASVWPSVPLVVTLVASDAGLPPLSSFMNITLQLNVAARYAPFTISTLPLVASVTDTTPVGSAVVAVSSALSVPNVTASLMAPVIVYSVVSGNQLGLFALDSTSGLLTLASRPSWTSSPVNLVVQLTSVYPTVSSSNVTVQITITPGSSSVPSFSQLAYTVSVSESMSSASQILQTVAAVSDSTATISYSLLSATSVFQVDQRGWISIATRFCRAAQSAYSFYVQATNSRSSLSTVAPVTVTIVTDWDNVPSFSPVLSLLNLRENVPIGYLVTQVSASVYNAPLANVTYTLAYDPLGLFNVDAQRGFLRVATRFTVATFGSTIPYTVRINAFGPAVSTIPSTVSINVMSSGSFSDALFTALNSSRSFAFTMLESDLTQPFSATNLGTVSFTPAGGAQVQFSVQNYSIVAGDPNAQFTVSSSGVLTTAKYITAAASPNFALRLIATLGVTSGSSSLYYAAVFVSVSVNSRLGNVPLFPSATPTVGVPLSLPNSAAPPGAAVLVLSAAESSPTNFTYSLSTSPFNCAYIDQSGVVYLGSAVFSWPVGYVTSQCSVNVSVVDAAGRSNSIAFGLQAAAYPFYAPFFAINTYRVASDSATPPGSVLWNASPALLAGVTNGSVATSLATGVTYAVAPNFAGTSSFLYAPAFLGTSPAGQLYTESSTFKVLLNSDGGFSPAGQRQQFVRNGALFAFGSSFAMQSATDNSLALRLIATPSGTSARSASANLQVVIADSGNVYAPTFSRSQYTFRLVENSPAPATVGFVQASDADAAANGEVLFALDASVSSSAWFSVDLVNGSLAALTQFDREALLFGSAWSLTDDASVLLTPGMNPLPTDLSSNTVFARNGTVYVKLQVIAYDRAAPPLQRSSTATVIVAIADANDNAPVFARSQSFATVALSAPVGTPVTRLRAVDLDQDSNAAITYTLLTANYMYQSLPFAIEPHTGLVYVAGSLATYPAELLSASKYIFNLTVRATDGGLPSLTSTCTLTIVVTPSNLNAPVFAATSAPGVPVNPTSVTLANSTPLGSLVCSYSALDADAGVSGLVQYALASGNDGSFLLDPVSGVLYLVDTPVSTTYTLTVLAYDQGIPTSFSVSLNTVVSIRSGSTTASPQPPVFSQSTTHYSVADSTSASAFVASLAVSNATGSVSYSVLAQTAYGPFGAASGGPYFSLASDGQLRTAASVSRATLRYALLYVRATDAATALNADQYVLISIATSSNAAPVWYTPEAVAVSSPTPTLLLAQDAPAQLSATSAGAMRYSVVSDSSGWFSVDSSSGLVTVSPQANLVSLYSVTFVASRTGSTAQSTTSVVFFSSNLAATTDSLYSARTYSLSVAENVAVNYTLLQGNVTAPAGATFYIINASRIDTAVLIPAPAGLFVVDRNTGSLRTGASLSIQTANQLLSPLGLASSSPVYYVEVWMLGSAPSQLRTPIAQVTIQVTSVQNSGPSFMQPFWIFSVSEDSNVGQFLFQSPQPTGQSSSVFTYWFINGSGTSTFQLDSLTGNVYLASALNRTSRSFYEIQLAVTDGSYNASCWLHMTVAPANMRAPVWNSSQPVFSVSELAPPNSVVGSLQGYATDADTGVNGSVSYYILPDGVASPNFAIDPYTNLLYTTTWLNYQQNAFFVLTVVAVDGAVWTGSTYPPAGDATRKSSSASVLVNVLATSNTVPVFTQSMYNFSLAASAQAGSTVGAVVLANWASLALVADVSFSIISASDPSLFTIEPLTGTVQLLRSPAIRATACQATTNSQSCRAPASVLQLTIGAFATGFRGTPRGSLLSSTSVTVTLVGLNTQPPVFTTPAIVTLNPYSFTTLSGPSVVWTVAAVDPQGTSVSFSLLNSSDTLVAAYFSLQAGTSGQLSITRNVTRQTLLARRSFSLLIQATDNGTPPLSAIQSLTFVFNDSNQFTPTFVTGTNGNAGCQISVSVSDSASLGTAVTQLNATDADMTLYPSVVRYYLVGGDPLNEWTIDRQLGTLCTNAPLDALRQSVYTIQVKAMDTTLTQSLASVCTVNVTVANANTYAPVFPDGPYLNLSVTDSLSSAFLPAAIVQVRAIDRDGFGLSYILQQTVQNTPLTIDSQTGIISLTSTSSLNRLSNPALSVIVQATDNGTPPQTSSTTVTVYVTTSVVQQPVLTGTSVLTQIAENSQVGISVAQVTAQLTSNGLVPFVNYSLAELPGSTSVNAAYFSVNPQNGLIVAQATFDREVTSTYRFSLVATASDVDAVVRRQAATTIVVSITDVIEFPPVFLQAAYTVWAPSPTPAGRFLIGVSTLSLDSSATGVPTFTLQNAPANTFVIDNQGAISTLSLITSVTSYSFTVLAASSQNPALQSSVTVSINFSASLSSVNLQLAGGSNAISLSESLPVGSTVTQVTAPNAGSLLSYSLVGGNQQETFGITSRTGQLYLRAALDYVMQPSYALWIQCVDYTALPTWTPSSSSAPPALGTVRVSITVQVDPTRHPLVFSPSNFVSVTYPQALPAQTVVTSLLVVDPLNSASLQLSVLPPSNSNFTVRQNALVSTQQVTAAGNGRPAMYTAVVAVNDSATGRSATCTVQITVLSITQTALRFSSLYAASVEELSTVGTFVAQVRAYRTYVDAPAPTANVDGAVQYAFASQTLNSGAPFSIDARSGVIVVNGTLNLAVTASYTLKVVASNAYASVQTDVSVNLIDVNNNAPVFSATSFTYVVYDGTAGTYQLDNIMATDADTGLNSYVSFRLAETPTRSNEMFMLANAQLAVGTSSVGLFTKPSAVFTYKFPCTDDCTTLNTLSLLLLATDSGFPPLTAAVNITVTVLPASASPISFPFSTYAFAVPFNTTLGATFAAITAINTDARGLPVAVRYIAPSGNATSFVNVGSQTGALSLGAALQFSNVGSVFWLQMLAYDASRLGATATCTVYLQVVVSASQFAPQFAAPSASSCALSFNESLSTASYSTALFTARAVETDGTNLLSGAAFSFSTFVNSTTYLVASPNSAANLPTPAAYSNLLAVSSNGTVFLTSPLNYDALEQLTFSLQAAELGPPAPRTSTLTCSVTVLPLDAAYTPVFTQSVLFIAVPAGASLGTPVADLRYAVANAAGTLRRPVQQFAMVALQSPFAALVASPLTQSGLRPSSVSFTTSNVPFALATNGSLTVVGTLSFPAEFAFAVSVSNSLNAASVASPSVALVRVHVSPSWTPSNTLRCSVSPSTLSLSAAALPTATPLGSIAASLQTAVDSVSVFSQLAYAIAPPAFIAPFTDSLLQFTVDVNGSVYLSAPLSVRYHSTFSLSAFAFNPAPIPSFNTNLCATSLSVTLSGPPLAASCAQSTYAVTLLDSVSVGSLIVQVSAYVPFGTGTNGSNAATFGYSLVNPQSSPFSIDSSSGQIRLIGPLNAALRSSYSLQVVAVPTGLTAQLSSANCAVQISVQSTSLQLGVSGFNVSLSVAELSPPGTIIGSLQAAFSSSSAAVASFSFVDASSAAAFAQLDAAGTLTLQSTPLRPQLPTFSAPLNIALLSGSGAPLSTVGLLNVYITDVDNAPPSTRLLTVRIIAINGRLPVGLVGQVAPLDDDLYPQYSCAFLSQLIDARSAFFGLTNGCSLLLFDGLFSTTQAANLTYTSSLWLNATDVQILSSFAPLTFSVNYELVQLDTHSLDNTVQLTLLNTDASYFLNNVQTPFETFLNTALLTSSAYVQLSLSGVSFVVIGLQQSGTTLNVLVTVSALTISNQTLIAQLPSVLTIVSGNSTQITSFFAQIGIQLSTFQSAACLYGTCRSSNIVCGSGSPYVTTVNRFTPILYQSASRIVALPGVTRAYAGQCGLSDVDACNGLNSASATCLAPTNYCSGASSSACASNGGVCASVQNGTECLCRFGAYGSTCSSFSIAFADSSYLTAAPISSSVVLEFATAQSNALLLFQPGPMATGGYLALEVRSGRPLLTIQLSSTSALQSISLSTLVVNSSQFFSLSVQRSTVGITLSAQQCFSGSLVCNGALTQQSLQLTASNLLPSASALYVGGVPSVSVIMQVNAQVASASFVGCIRRAFVNGMQLVPALQNAGYTGGSSDVLTQLSSQLSFVQPSSSTWKCSQRNGQSLCTQPAYACPTGAQCVDEWTTARCICPSGLQPPTCTTPTTPFTFSGNAYLVFSPRASYQRTLALTAQSQAVGRRRKRQATSSYGIASNVQMQIAATQTTATNSVLLYAVAATGDFAMLALANGLLLYVSSVSGSQQVASVSTASLVNSGVHTISFTQQSAQSVLLTVDSTSQSAPFSVGVRGFLSSDVTQLLLGSTGGSQSSITLQNGNSLSTQFVGCISQVQFANETQPFGGLSSQFSITTVSTSNSSQSQSQTQTQQCPSSLACSAQSCPSGQICQSLNNTSWGSFTCVAGATTNSSSLSAGAIAGIVVGALVFVAIIVLLVVFLVRKGVCGVEMFKRRKAASQRFARSDSATDTPSQPAGAPPLNGIEPNSAVNPAYTPHGNERDRTKVEAQVLRRPPSQSPTDTSIQLQSALNVNPLANDAITTNQSRPTFASAGAGQQAGPPNGTVSVGRSTAVNLNSAGVGPHQHLAVPAPSNQSAPPSLPYSLLVQNNLDILSIGTANTIQEADDDDDEIDETDEQELEDQLGEVLRIPGGIPIEYDIDKASSIAPSDVDVSKHYHAYRAQLARPNAAAAPLNIPGSGNTPRATPQPNLQTLHHVPITAASLAAPKRAGNNYPSTSPSFGGPSPFVAAPSSTSSSSHALIPGPATAGHGGQHRSQSSDSLRSSNSSTPMHNVAMLSGSARVTPTPKSQRNTPAAGAMHQNASRRNARSPGGAAHHEAPSAQRTELGIPIGAAARNSAGRSHSVGSSTSSSARSSVSDDYSYNNESFTCSEFEYVRQPAPLYSHGANGGARFPNKQLQKAAGVTTGTGKRARLPSNGNASSNRTPSPFGQSHSPSPFSHSHSPSPFGVPTSGSGPPGRSFSPSYNQQRATSRTPPGISIGMSTFADAAAAPTSVSRSTTPLAVARTGAPTPTPTPRAPTAAIQLDVDGAHRPAQAHIQVEDAVNTEEYI